MGGELGAATCDRCAPFVDSSVSGSRPTIHRGELNKRWAIENARQLLTVPAQSSRQDFLRDLERHIRQGGDAMFAAVSSLVFESVAPASDFSSRERSSSEKVKGGSCLFSGRL